MLAYGFQENIDFTSVESFTVVNNGAKKTIAQFCAKVPGGRPATEYYSKPFLTNCTNYIV